MNIFNNKNRNKILNIIQIPIKMIRIANINEKLPAGLADKSVEFYIHEGDIFCLHGGKTYPFSDIPTHILDKVKADMMANKSALKAMNTWGIQNDSDKLKQYIACRYGAFDQTPDMTEDGVMRPSEYVDCGRRGQCPNEGKLCSAIAVKNGFLNKKEITVLKYMGAGLLDKEIYMAMEISDNSLRYYKDRIRLKTGLLSKTSFAVLAHQLNLL